MRKIIFIHLFNDRSGSPKVLSDVIDCIDSVNQDFELITSCHSGGFLSKFSKQTRNVFYKRSENKLLTLIWYLMSQLHLFWLCLKYRKQNVTFYANTMLPFAAGIAGALMRKPVIYHIHETSIKPNVLKWFLRSVINLTSDKVIFVSNYLSKTESFSHPMSYVIYNTVNQPALKELQKDCFSKKNFNVLMVCSLKAYKGVYEFISLANLLSEFTAFNFILVLNASGEEIAKTLNKPLPENLKLFSRQSNLKPFYQDASVVLSLSRPDGWIETFGLTIVEAMSYSIPVIVPTVGGPAEIVVDGVDGYQISCYELDKIQAKLIELYRDTEQYHRVSKAAYDKSKEFDIDVFKQKMLEVIND